MDFFPRGHGRRGGKCSDLHFRKGVLVGGERLETGGHVEMGRAGECRGLAEDKNTALFPFLFLLRITTGLCH